MAAASNAIPTISRSIEGSGASAGDAKGGVDPSPCIMVIERSGSIESEVNTRQPQPEGSELTSPGLMSTTIFAHSTASFSM
jgi:hypothetical protein